VNLASSSSDPGEVMENAALRTLIRVKLLDGRLPLNGISRVWGGPSDGEQCDACDRLITDPLVIEGIASLLPGKKSVQMHVDCFAIWDEERQDPRS
jgi:hypothetical protein